MTLMANIKIPLPPLNIQQEIVVACEVVDEAVRQAQATIDHETKEIEDRFLAAQSQATKKIRLSDSIFELSIGKRVLKSEINEIGEGCPVYSANVFEPFGFTTKTLLTDFSMPSVLWGIDGDWMVNCLDSGVSFYPTDHCGILRVKTDEIEPEYIAWALRQEGARVNFTRSYRASIDRVSGLTLDLPPQEIQMQLVQELKESKHKITEAQRIIDNAPAQKQAILKQYL